MEGKNLSYEEVSALERNIGFAKGFMELLYGCYATETMQDNLSGDLLYLVSDARDYLKKSLDLLSGQKEVEA